jgi:hypothetical protein
VKRRSLLLLPLAALGLTLGLTFPAPAHAGQGGTFDVPIEGAVLNPVTGQPVNVSGTAKVHINFDGPGGGCIHVTLNWHNVLGLGPGGMQYDGQGLSQYEQPVNPDLSQITFPTGFDLVADRPGGGCIHVNAQVAITTSPDGGILILIGLLPQSPNQGP